MSGWGAYTDSHDGHVSVVDALYYTTVTLTTTGYGDITPVTTTARLINSVIVSSETAGRLLGLAADSPHPVQVVEDLLSFGQGIDLAERAVTAGEIGASPQALDVPVLAVVREDQVHRYNDPTSGGCRPATGWSSPAPDLRSGNVQERVVHYCSWRWRRRPAPVDGTAADYVPH